MSHPLWSVVTSAAIVARIWQAVYVYEHTSKTMCDAVFCRASLAKGSPTQRVVEFSPMSCREHTCVTCALTQGGLYTRLAGSS